MSQLEVDKIIPQSGTTLTIGDSGDTITVASGATLTGDLNADNLTSGTVPSARVSGAYTGITQTGILASFASTGIDDNATSTAITIDSGGRVGIGTITSLNEKLQAHSSGSTFLQLTTTNTGTADNNGLYVGVNSSGVGFLGLRDTNGNPLLFQTENTERMRIDSSGNLLVGKSLSNSNTAGAEFRPDGVSIFGRDGNTPVLVNRKTSDGKIISVRKDNTEVGSIGVHNTRITIGNQDTGLKFNSGIDSIFPFDLSIEANRDNAVDLGWSSARFRDLYLGGGAYIGGTGTANKLDDYEEGTWTPGLENVTVSFTSRTGQYVKVGKLVYFAGTIVLASNDTGDSSSVRISGLPFAIDDTNNSILFTMNASLSTLFDSYHNVGGAYVGSILSTAIDIGDNSNGSAIQYEDLQASGTMVFSGQYITT